VLRALVEVLAENGARASLAAQHSWQGVSRRVFEVRWEAQSGWVTLSFDRTSICILRDEIGGRGELRSSPGLTAGEYLGDSHLSLVATGEPVTLRASALRKAKLVCFVLEPRAAPELSTEQVESIESARSRLMFRDDRLSACAQLLSDYPGQTGSDAYAMALTRALLAAVLGVLTPPAQSHDGRLSASTLVCVLEHIDAHLDRSMTNDELAGIAGLAPGVFGHAFREVTGMSPPRWQMGARVRRAQRLMFDEPAKSLASVALRAGFSDQSHFSRAFLDIVGVSPRAWLHQHR